MYPYPIITIFGRGIYLYGLLIGLGIIACFIVLYGYGRLLKVSQKLLDFSFYNGIGAIIAGFGCAALWQAIYNYIENPADGFHFGGITVIGGLIGGTAFFLIIYFAVYRRLTEERIIYLHPIAPCCIVIAHGFGRIGCFFAGCCHGKATDSWLGMQFPGETCKVFPTQLWEALFLFFLFGLFSYLIFRHKFRMIMPLYMACYGTFRFIIEFFRGDARGSFIPGVSPSQFWCILIVLGSIPYFILLARAYKKLDAKTAAATATAKLGDTGICEEQTSVEVTRSANNTSDAEDASAENKSDS